MVFPSSRVLIYRAVYDPMELSIWSIFNSSWLIRRI